MSLYRARWVARALARLVFVVLLSLLLAGLGYMAIVAIIMWIPPRAIG